MSLQNLHGSFGGSTELLKADASFDVWSLGILFMNFVQGAICSPSTLVMTTLHRNMIKFACVHGFVAKLRIL